MQERPLDVLNAIAGQARRETDQEMSHARPDIDREDRKGVPEVILAAQKTPEQVAAIARAFLASKGRAIISKVSPTVLSALEQDFSSYDVQTHPLSEMVVIRRPGEAPQRAGGRVGIVTAGTSDVPVAEQAAVVAREMGCDVTMVSDVGVAGIHRLFQPLRDLLAASVDVIVVAAGMDGALPSVVAGLVDVAVIGLPTSTGYGYGGQGTAALMSMLQTCSPGLAVVNIDNGIGAGATAGLIANRVARARAASRSTDRAISEEQPEADGDQKSTAHSKDT